MSNIFRTSKHALCALYTNGSIAWTLASRESKSKYAGSTLAYVWIVLTPLIYAFVFVLVREHLSQTGMALGDSTVPPILVAFSGVLLWQVWIETLLRQIDFIRSGRVFLTSLRVPVEIFFYARFLNSAIDFGVRFAIIVVASFIFMANAGPSIILAFFSALCLILTSNLIGMYLAFPGSFFSDVTKTIQSISLGLFLISPVFYSVTEDTPFFLYLINVFHPFGSWIQTFRDSAFGGDFLLLRPALIWAAILLIPAPFALAYYRTITPRIIERI